VDATIKQAQVKSESQRNKDSSFTKRGSKTIYGYKGHVGVDFKSNVIRSVEFTPADIRDTQKFNDLLLSIGRAVYAGKGYANSERLDSHKRQKKLLQRQWIFCGILDKGDRDIALTQVQKRCNKKLSAICDDVEQPCAFFKQVLQYTRGRYFDPACNRLQFVLSVVAYNIREKLSLNVKNNKSQRVEYKQAAPMIA